MSSVPFRKISDDDLVEVSTSGGRTTTTAQGVTHVAPGSSGITPELIDTHDAARLCGIAERTIWRWSNSGLMPKPIKIGRGLRAAVRFRRSELMEWIAAGCPRIGKGGQR